MAYHMTVELVPADLRGLVYPGTARQLRVAAERIALRDSWEHRGKQPRVIPMRRMPSGFYTYNPELEQHYEELGNYDYLAFSFNPFKAIKRFFTFKPSSFSLKHIFGDIGSAIGTIGTLGLGPIISSKSFSASNHAIQTLGTVAAGIGAGAAGVLALAPAGTASAIGGSIESSLGSFGANVVSVGSRALSIGKNVFGGLVNKLAEAGSYLGTHVLTGIKGVGGVIENAAGAIATHLLFPDQSGANTVPKTIDQAYPRFYRWLSSLPPAGQQIIAQIATPEEIAQFERTGVIPATWSAALGVPAPATPEAQYVAPGTPGATPPLGTNPTEESLLASQLGGIPGGFDISKLPWYVWVGGALMVVTVVSDLRNPRRLF